MMEKDDIFKDFLKKGIEQSEFPYKDSYWSDAVSMLEEKEKLASRKRMKNIIFSAALLLVGVAGYFAGIYQHASMEHSKKQAAVVSAEPDNSITDSNLPSLPQTGNANPLKEVDMHSQTNASTGFASSQKNVSNSAITPENDNSVSNGSMNIPSGSSAKKAKRSRTSGNNPIALRNSFSKQGLPSEVQVKQDELLASTDYLLPLALLEPDALGTEEFGKVKEGELSLLPNYRTPDHSLLHQYSHLYRPVVFVSAAPILSKSFTSNDSLAGNSGKISPGAYLGLGFRVAISRNFHLEVAPGIFTQGGINTVQRVEEKSYDFGSTTTEFVLEYKRLFLFELPVMLGYNCDKHSFSAGFAPSTIVNNLSKIKDFNAEESQKLGYSEGIQRFSGSVYLVYNYRIFDEWNAFAGFQYGLHDMVKINSGYDRNIQYRLGIKYRLPFQQHSPF